MYVFILNEHLLWRYLLLSTSFIRNSVDKIAIVSISLFYFRNRAYAFI